MAVAIVTREEQNRSLSEHRLVCGYLIQNETQQNGTNCKRIWDGIMCWPPTENGTTAILPCPNFINGFKILENATRRCNPNGEWWVPPGRNSSWTNLTQCMSESRHISDMDIPEIIAANMSRIRLMYNIGYGVSLASLVLAVTIMLYFKRLHCSRNMIHINLFLSFILRALISFVKENVLVYGVGFPGDVLITPDGTIEFLENSSHWQCKLFFTLFNYFLGANYMWIFAEGIYLHMLITVAMFSEKSGIKRLILFGWGAPILFVIPWVIVRATLEDVICWNTHPTHGYFWIIRGPIVAAMVINFIIFLNIIRVLFTKLTAFKTPDAKRYRYRKLAKSTLVLIPLFGVHYIVFIGLPDNVDQRTELVKLYYEMFFNSFQGFFVSLLFCFFNGEVQTEIKKKWNRFVLKRDVGAFSRRGHRDTVTSYVSRARLSTASSNMNSDPPVGNGKVVHTSDINNTVSFSSENSENVENCGQDGRTTSGCDVEMRKVSINGCSDQPSDVEEGVHIEMMDTFDTQDKNTESQPMLNNNSVHFS